MWPPPASPMIGSAAWVQYRRPSRLTLIMRCQCSTSAPATGPSNITPSLLIRMSSPSSAAADSSTNERAAAWSVTSTSWTWTVPPSRPIRSASASRRSRRRAPAATAAPWLASACTVASPIPDEAPVTTALRPSREPAILGTRGRRLDRRLRGDLLGLTDRGAVERVGQRPHVGAGRCLEDVGGHALAARQPAVGTEHDRHLAQGILALGDRRDGVRVELGLLVGRRADGAEDRVHRPVAPGLADRVGARGISNGHRGARRSVRARSDLE